MRQAVCRYAECAAEKLRGERQFCRYISVFAKTSPFAVNEPYYGNVASEKPLIPTQDTQDIIAAAVRILDRIWMVIDMQKRVAYSTISLLPGFRS